MKKIKKVVKKESKVKKTKQDRNLKDLMVAIETYEAFKQLCKDYGVDGDRK